MTPKESCEREIARFFKKYYKFCASSDSDDLKELLATLCSAFEKIETFTEQRLKKNERYIALKALRNFSTHESELLNDSRALKLHSPTLVLADVGLLCLIPVDAINYVIKNIRSDFTKRCVEKNVIYYDKFVDLYPALFNISVDLYFLVKEHSLVIKGDGYLSISKAIQYEVTNGHSHYIDGRIVMLDGSDVNVFLDSSVISIDERVAETSSLPIDEDGLYSITSSYSRSPLEQVESMKAEDKEHILQKLLSTEAILIKKNSSGEKVGHMNRELHPIEVVIANEYLESI